MDAWLNELPTEEDEAKMLANRDVEDMNFHRMDYNRGLSRHLIQKKTSEASMFQVGQTEDEEKSDKMNKMLQRMYSVTKMKEWDHSPHDLFVEMDELEGDMWVEQARWIKYEEDREIGSERWGKAHISSLSFHSLINLRLCLENGKHDANNSIIDVYS